MSFCFIAKYNFSKYHQHQKSKYFFLKQKLGLHWAIIYDRFQHWTFCAYHMCLSMFKVAHFCGKTKQLVLLHMAIELSLLISRPIYVHFTVGICRPILILAGICVSGILNCHHQYYHQQFIIIRYDTITIIIIIIIVTNFDETRWDDGWLDTHDTNQFN